jgi:hypothetical protein
MSIRRLMTKSLMNLNKRQRKRKGRRKIIRMERQIYNGWSKKQRSKRDSKRIRKRSKAKKKRNMKMIMINDIYKIIFHL